MMLSALSKIQQFVNFQLHLFQLLGGFMIRSTSKLHCFVTPSIWEIRLKHFDQFCDRLNYDFSGVLGIILVKQKLSFL